MENVEILIPIYKPRFSATEEFSIDHSLQALKERNITFIAPTGLDVSYYAKRYQGRFQFFAADAFSSVRSYSTLLVSRAFYETFGQYEWILILQPDAYIFEDRLDYWCTQPIDYVGAPWPKGFDLNINSGVFAQIGGKQVRTYVGNGGLSLRRVKACLALIEEFGDIAGWFAQSGSNEDLFFSVFGSLSKHFRIPNQMVASTFSLELEPENYYRLNGEQLPMGTHAYAQWDPEFWARFIPPWPAG